MTDSTTKPLADFVDQLLQEGRAITRDSLHRREPERADLHQAAALLAVANQHAAEEAPWVAPPFDEAAAVWAASAFAWAAGMLIDRGETDVSLPKWISSKVPASTSVSAHWSVDLVFRLAADLFHRSEKICEGDPLQDSLQRLFAPWPLACVGTTIESRGKCLAVVMNHDCLRATYVDRVLIRCDAARAESEPVKSLIQKIAGAYPELAVALGNDP